MSNAKCPICSRTKSVLNEPLYNFTSSLQALGFPKRVKVAHSSCVIRILKQRLKEQKANGIRPDKT